MQNTIKKATPLVPIAIVIIVIGLILMAMKIYADSEPGAIPLFLVVLGIGLYVAARRRVRSRQT